MWWVCRAAVAAALFGSAFQHALQPYGHVHAIAGYQILPEWSLLTAAAFLPAFHVLLATLCLLPGGRGVGLSGAATLMLVYTIAQASALVRGLAIDCGCFGQSSAAIGAGSLVVPLVLAITAAAAAWSGRSTAMSVTV